MSDSRPPIRGYIDPNFPNPNQPGDASIIIYGYTPSFVLAILGCVLFLVALIAHLVQLVKFRSWYFSTMVVGIAFVRVRSHQHGSLCSRCTGNCRLRIPHFISQNLTISRQLLRRSVLLYRGRSSLLRRSNLHRPLHTHLRDQVQVLCATFAQVDSLDLHHV